MESTDQKLKKRVSTFTEIDRILGLDDSGPSLKSEIYKEFERKTKAFLNKYGKKLQNIKKMKKSDLKFMTNNKMKIQIKGPSNRSLKNGSASKKGKSGRGNPGFLMNRGGGLKSVKSNGGVSFMNKHNSLLLNMPKSSNMDSSNRRNALEVNTKKALKTKSKKKIGNTNLIIYKK